MYKNFMFDIDTDDIDKQEVDNIIERMLKLKFSKKSCNRPPKVVIVGPLGVVDSLFGISLLIFFEAEIVNTRICKSI